MLYDKDIREPLFRYIEDNFGKVRIIEEKQIGKSRADVVLIRDSCITGLEIKSDADTYARLERQVLDYNRCFDLNYVVVGTSHANSVETHIPDWWGIITVDEIEGGQNGAHEADFYILRNPKPNPRIHHMFLRKRQLDFLWRPELFNIQMRHNMPKYSGKSKRFIRDYLFENIDEDTLKKEITDELFERDYSTINETIRKYKEEHGSMQQKKKKKRKRRTG